MNVISSISYQIQFWIENAIARLENLLGLVKISMGVVIIGKDAMMSDS